MWHWLSCRKYSERASRKLDHDLPQNERPAYWFHHFICYACRRFSRQLDLMHRACSCLGEHLAEEGEEKLPPDVARRIERAMKEGGSEPV